MTSKPLILCRSYEQMYADIRTDGESTMYLPVLCIVLIVEQKCMCIGQAMAREYHNIHAQLTVKFRLLHGEYKITHTGSTQEADRWHNVYCESAFQ